MKNNALIHRLPQRSILAALVGLALTPTVYADAFSAPELTHSQSDFGGVGLMQMPTARSMPEGELSFGVTNNDEYLHYTMSLQLFPWLETTIRYTQVHDMLYSNDESFSGDTDYTDKSIDAKLRVWEESYYLPEVAIGLRDIGGTGLFDGEYIAASKRVGPLDFTLGVGWGYIGNRGNLIGDKDSSSDCGRNTGYSGNGGSVDISRMFGGCAAVYGGVEYQTPWAPLSLKLEYDGNDYRSDFPVTRGKNDMSVSTPWNVGMVYAFNDWAKLRLSYERGNTITAGFTMATNLATLSQTWVDEPMPTYQPQQEKDDLTPDEWIELTKQIGQVAGYERAKVYKNGETVTVTGEQTRYRQRKEAEERAALLIANTGVKAQTYRFINTAQDQPVTETRINTYSFKRVADHDYPNAAFDDARETGNPVAVSGELKAQTHDDWKFGLAPSLTQSFGGSEDFYLYAIGVKANASYRLGDHFLISGSLYGNLLDNYDKFKYTVPPDGTNLKRVRTLTRQYYEDTFRVDNLQLTYFDRLSRNVYGQAYAGYLETMFAGVGSEFLYRPLNQNWAFGIEGNYVKQRDPDTYLNLYKQERHYDSQTSRYYRVQTGVLTGHATLYWQPKFWDMFDNTLFKISAGRYLSEDKGITVDFSKQFDSGVIAGVFATKTNLSASEYGEGSFSKGFYVSIPLDLMTVKPSTDRATLSWLPLQRDGGSKLHRQYSLYDMTDARSPWFTRPPQY